MRKQNLLDLPEEKVPNLNPTQLKKWENDISTAKSKDKQNELRRDFKKQFGVAYSKKLLQETTVKESVPALELATTEVEPENREEIIGNQVQGVIIKLDDFVGELKEIEDTEMVNVVASEDLNKAAKVIDEEKDKVVMEAKDNLSAVIGFESENLSEEQKIEIAAIEKDMAKASQILMDERNKLNNLKLSPDEEKKVYQKIDDMVEYQVYAFNKINQIKGIKTPELEVTSEPTIEPGSEPTPETTIELSPEPSPEPTPETSPKVEKNKFEKEFSDYAKKMGIKEEQLAAHPEFMELNPVQRQYILETLNRTALNRVKVEGNKNYLEEKASKKWYELGYAFNQKFHKGKHEINVAKNIHEQGLAGYGETEFNWLVETFKNGPEISVNSENEVEVKYLRDEAASEEQKELFNSYNKLALLYTNSSDNYVKQENLLDQLDNARFEILKSEPDFNKSLSLTRQLLEAEKYIEFIRSSKASQENEKIMAKLIESSTGGLSKFAKLMGSHSDKAAYAALGATGRILLRSEVAHGLLGKAFSYAAGPLVAAAIGGLRANNRAVAGLKETNQLAELGVEDKGDMAKTYNLAVGQKDNDGNKINVGLSDKLEALVEKYNLLERDYYNSKGENRENIAKKLNELQETLFVRINYTKGRMNDKLISYGSPEEMVMNRYKLLDSVINAQTRASAGGGLITERTNFWRVSRKDKNLTRLGGRSEAKYQAEVSYEEIKGLSVADRLASFLDYNEAKRSRAEFKYLLKETGKGAAMGATCAVVAAWVMDQTGMGEAINHGLRKLIHEFSSTKGGGDVNSVIDNAKEALPGANKNIDTQVVEAKIVSQNIPEASSAKAVEFSDKITNENLGGKHDSVWRSTREIFKNHATELGFKGDVNNSAELNRWAETQTATTINNSGEFTNKVFEGNEVNLEKDASGNLIIKIESADGPEPGFSSEPITEAQIKTQVDFQTHTPAHSFDNPVDKTIQAPKVEDSFAPKARVTDEIKADAGNKLIIKEVSAKTFIEDSALKNGFRLGAEDISGDGSATKIELAGRPVIVNFINNQFSYEWNGINHDFSFEPGEAAKSNMETFLAQRNELEKMAETVQDNLANGKIRSFRALERLLKGINGGDKLPESAANLWHETFHDYFTRNSASLLEGESKLRIAKQTMNIFLSEIGK